MDAHFSHYPLQLISPEFDSTLTELIIDLDYLKKVAITSTTPVHLFYDLKEFFHFLESIGSARIEGNNTTVAEFLETKIEVLPAEERDAQSIREITNIEESMRFVEEWVREGRPINETFVKSLQALAVQGLEREGDRHAGDYRKGNVRIANASHCPPDASSVPAYMEELFQFLSQETPDRYSLLKVALAHHRFVWIHPFGNGNGRTVRLLTYALLLHYGYGLDQQAGIVNPTAIFCSDREKYYELLAAADSGDKEKLLQWCEYVLRGLKLEIEKVNRLCDYSYVSEAILRPTVSYAYERGHISPEEYQVLLLAIKLGKIQNADLKPLFPKKTSSRISQIIRQLTEKKMLEKLPENSRKYVLRFRGSLLLRGLMRALDREGFLPLKDEVTF